ncbi:tRNA-dihydrouridine synthase B [Desulfurella multipotens]|uniref:tRNA-dihydrouridine synthase n=1 Tax=Desulfurella multipotens TaxID=79269 RepID=A0A1G6KMQ4_9BACT|nr:tRNA-dihydrouridine synthase family protein [Desulfurella multipotens]SDC32108.1 tRNA-dihydrouridine synthase B [Desulfurella multipotens]
MNFSSNYFLAPMASYTDKPFRKIAKDYGAGLTVSELISINSIYYNNPKAFALAKRNYNEIPFAIQLFGYDIDLFIKAALKIESMCDIIDINAGCPVPKVLKAKAGAYLLKEKKHLISIVESLKKYIKKPVSVKVRMGFDNDNINTIDFYKDLENAGCDMVTIHARLRNGFYNSSVDYEHIALVCSRLKIPVVANGGIDSYEKLKEVKKITNCKYFMIGQAALKKPYIFEDLLNKKDSSRNIEYIKNLMLNHFTLMIEEYGENAHKLFRKFAHRYLSGYKNAKLINFCINNSKNSQEILNIINSIK